MGQIGSGWGPKLIQTHLVVGSGSGRVRAKPDPNPSQNDSANKQIEFNH